MGSPESEAGRYTDERQHPVTLTRGFWLAATEVTQRQYLDVMGENPSRFKQAGLDAPVENVSWDDAPSVLREIDAAGTRRGPIARRLGVPSAHRGAVGIRLPGRKSNGLLLWRRPATTGPICVVRTMPGRCTHPVATKKANALWLVRHARQCVGMVPGLVCANTPHPRLSTDPAGPDAGSGPGRAGRWLVQHRPGTAAPRCRYRVLACGPVLLPGLSCGRSSSRAQVQARASEPEGRGRARDRNGKFGELEFVKIPPGEFTMGSPESEEDRHDDETQHRVRIYAPVLSGALRSHPAAMAAGHGNDAPGTGCQGRTTDDPLEGVKGEGPNFPMYHVNWSEAIAYCEKLTAAAPERRMCCPTATSTACPPRRSGNTPAGPDRRRRSPWETART